MPAIDSETIREVMISVDEASSREEVERNKRKSNVKIPVKICMNVQKLYYSFQ